MNGAEAMIRTLVDAGVTTCFTNPGTSEMHFVAALDTVPEMRGVLGLFEGVATGAADGYARMAGVPGRHAAAPRPGSRQRAGQPAQRPPGGDADGQHRRRPRHLPRPARRPAELRHRDRRPQRVGLDRAARSAPPTCAAITAEAVAAAIGPPGQVATLILPADVSWSDGAEPVAPAAARRQPAAVDGGDDRARRQGAALGRAGGAAARRFGDASGVRSTRPGASPRRPAPGCSPRRSSARTERGAGIPAVEKLQYFGEMALQQLAGLRHLVLVDARSPVSFFAYPDKPSELVPDGCEVHVLAGGRRRRRRRARARSPSSSPTVDGVTARRRRGRSDRPASSPAQTLAAAVAAVMPEDAIVSDEGATAGDLDGRGDGGLPAPRLAAADRRGDRPGLAAGHRRRRRLPGPTGAQPRRPTGRRCTRSRRCGRRPGSRST